MMERGCQGESTLVTMPMPMPMPMAVSGRKKRCKSSRGNGEKHPIVHAPRTRTRRSARLGSRYKLDLENEPLDGGANANSCNAPGKRAPPSRLESDAWRGARNLHSHSSYRHIEPVSPGRSCGQSVHCSCAASRPASLSPEQRVRPGADVGTALVCHVEHGSCGLHRVLILGLIFLSPGFVPPSSWTGPRCSPSLSVCRTTAAASTGVAANGPGFSLCHLHVDTTAVSDGWTNGSSVAWRKTTTAATRYSILLSARTEQN